MHAAIISKDRAYNGRYVNNRVYAYNSDNILSCHRDYIYIAPLALGQAALPLMKFEDLKIPYGYAVQLQTGSNDASEQRLSCRVVGCVPGRTIMVTQPRNGRFRTGQKLVARLMVANGICLFPVTIESTANHPLPMYCLSYPSSVSFKEIRGATRVDVSLPIEVKNLSALEDQQTMGQLGDVSTSGAKIELREAVVSVGDELELSGDVEVGSIQRNMKLTAVVRSRIERSTKEMDSEFPAVYGIEFIEKDEERLLMLYAYVYSEMALS